MPKKSKAVARVVNRDLVTMKRSELSKRLAVARTDGWANALTGIGQLDRDKRKGASIVRDVFDYETLADTYRADDMFARIVDLYPNEMTREGFELKIQDGKDDAEMVMAKFDELQVLKKLNLAMRYARVWGGAGVLIGADDGSKQLALPLDLPRVEDIKWLTVLDKRELVPVTWYDDPLSDKYGQVMIYRIQPQIGVSQMAMRDEGLYPLIHESRILRFDGVEVTRLQMRGNHGWGDPLFIRIAEILPDFHLLWSSVANLVQDFSQAVFKIKGLAELLANNDDDVVVKRMQMIDLSRSVARGVLLDSEEEFSREPTPLAGLSDLLEKFALRLAAAAGLPVSLLMGQAPAGLNATGDADVRWFYDQVKARQRDALKPALDYLARIIFLAKKSPTKGIEPENWSIEFKPLWQLTDAETAELRNKQADTDSKMVQAQILTPEEVAISRFGGDAYSLETQIDVDARKKMLAALPIEDRQVDPNQPDDPAQDQPAGGKNPPKDSDPTPKGARLKNPKQSKKSPPGSPV